ncbi:TolC family protein [Maricaulis sp. D1M11]
MMTTRSALVLAVSTMGLLASGVVEAQSQTPGVSASQVQCLGFRETLFLALDRAPEIGAAEARSEEAEAVVREVRSLRLPQVSTFGRGAVGDNGLSTTQIENQYGLRVSQRVWDFGDSRYALDAARAGLDRQASVEDSVRLGTAMTVAQAYLMQLEAESLLRVVDERREYFSRQQRSVDALLAEGGATRAESAQIAAELAQAEAEMMEIQSVADRAAVRIYEYAGVWPSLCSVEALESAMGQMMRALPDAQTAVDRALDANPQLSSRRASVRSLEAQRERQRRSRLPVVEVVGIVSYAYDDDFDTWQARDRVGVDVSVPLYTGSALGARNDQAQARLSGEEFALRAEQRDVREEAHIAFRRQLSLASQLVRREAVADSQFAYFDAISGEFQYGLGTLPDLVSARLNYEQAELDVVRARFQLIREQLGLLNLTAQLLDTAPDPETAQ